MTRGIIFPIILILIAGGIFWTFIDPAYSEVKTIQAEIAVYDDALDKSKELQKIRDQLRERYNSFSTDDLDRLHLLLPDTVDNIRLILDIDTIASRYGVSIQGLNIAPSQASGGFDPKGGEIKSVDLTFSISSDYNTFLAFVRDLQDSLRLIDIIEINFNVAELVSTSRSITIRTYWLP